MSTKQERLSVFKETMKAALSHEYPIGRNKERQIDGTEEMMSTTKFYTKRVEIDNSKVTKSHTEQISIRNMDSLEAAKELINQGFRPAVLNMASFSTPGGGVERGSQAQEEIICRRTNLLMSLYQFHKNGDNYGIQQSQDQYPLSFPFSIAIESICSTLDLIIEASLFDSMPSLVSLGLLRLGNVMMSTYHGSSRNS